jgi:DNA-binding NtrC family response regulator
MQVRLLRLLEAGSFRRGETLRSIFAWLPTRRDLYYRLNVAGPPAGMRERREDVVLVS